MYLNMDVIYHLILHTTLKHFLLGVKKKKTTTISEIPKFTIEYCLQQLLSVVTLALPLFLCYVMGIFIPIE